MPLASIERTVRSEIERYRASVLGVKKARRSSSVTCTLIALGGEPPLQLDAAPAKTDILEYMRNESRFRMVEKENPDRFRHLVEQARRVTRERESVYRYLAGLTVPVASAEEPEPAPAAPAATR